MRGRVEGWCRVREPRQDRHAGLPATKVQVVAAGWWTAEPTVDGHDHFTHRSAAERCQNRLVRENLQRLFQRAEDLLCEKYREAACAPRQVVEKRQRRRPCASLLRHAAPRGVRSLLVELVERLADVDQSGFELRVERMPGRGRMIRRAEERRKTTRSFRDGRALVPSEPERFEQ